MDAMGGDHAPEVVVQGALQAVSEWGIDIIPVGQKGAIAGSLAGCQKARIHVRHCTETVLMDESPLRAIRRKRDSSIRIAFGLAKKGEADAVVSA